MPSAAVGRLEHLEAVGLERDADERAHLGLVFDDEHDRGVRALRRSSATTSRRERRELRATESSGSVKRKDAPTTWPRLDPDASAVRAHDTPADREAEPDPAALALADAIKLVEHAVGVRTVDARTAVGDLDLDLPLAARAPRCRSGVSGGVYFVAFSIKIDEHLLDEHRVEGDEGQVRGDVACPPGGLASDRRGGRGPRRSPPRAAGAPSAP